MQAGRQQSCHPACYRPRDRGQRCQRSFPASQGHEPRQQSCHGSCSRPSHAQPGSVMRTVIARATTPTSLHLRSRFVPCPLPRLALRLRSSLVPAPSPAAVPGGPDKDHASKAVMVFASCPALSRLPCGTCTAPSVGAGWLPGRPDESGLRGVERCSTSSNHQRIPRRSFSIRTHRATGPAPNGVACGHFILRLRRIIARRK